MEDDGNNLKLTWKEMGGPAVTAPLTCGFGTKLVQTTISQTLRGRLEQGYAPRGYQAKIIVPLKSAAAGTTGCEKGD